MDRLWLDVPFSQKDQAKTLGAKWDPRARRWYAPAIAEADLAQWLAGSELPSLLPGEDRDFGQGLFVDLVPSSCWFTNVRSCVSEMDWERIRRMVIPRAGSACEICRRKEDRKAKRWMEVHERWDFDVASRVQTLKRLICLCTDCHQATHFGFAEVRGRAEQAREHLQAVTGLPAVLVTEMIEGAFELWAQRSQSVWTLNLGILTGVDVEITPPPSARSRDVEAWRRLQFG